MAGLGLRRLGAISEAGQLLAQQATRTALHAAVGDAAARRRWMTMLSDASFATIVHPSALVSPSAQLGGGDFIGPLAVINARATLDEGVIINTGAIVEHDCRIGAFTHVAPGAVLAGDVTVGHDALIGAGAVIHPGVKVGSGVAIGAGAVAVSDIHDGARVAGVPARPIDRVQSEEASGIRR